MCCDSKESMASGSRFKPNVIQSSFPFFKGEGYDRWSVRMKTLFWSQNLCSVVGKSALKEGDEAQVIASNSDDAKTLYLIQQ